VVNDGAELDVGDPVFVPWGLDEVEGEIAEIYSTGLGPRARVSLGGAFSEESVVLPLDSLKPRRRMQDHSRPSAKDQNQLRRMADDYESRLNSALKRTLHDFNMVGPYVPARDTAADFELRWGARRLLVEAKYYRTTGHVPTDTVMTVAGLAGNDTGVLLVSNAGLASATQQRLERLWHLHTHVWFVQWRSQADDQALRAALSKFVRNWR
jgi:hypothetical protein